MSSEGKEERHGRGITNCTRRVELAVLESTIRSSAHVAFVVGNDVYFDDRTALPSSGWNSSPHTFFPWRRGQSFSGMSRLPAHWPNPQLSPTTHYFSYPDTYNTECTLSFSVVSE